MAPETLLILGSGAFAAASFVSWRLNRIVQPMRVEMVEMADTLLSRPDLPDMIRILVEDNVRTVFGVRGRLLIGIFLGPLVAILFLVRQRLLPNVKAARARLTPEDRELFQEICDLHDRITFVNHPILFPLFLLVLTPCVMAAVLIRGLTRGAIDRPGSIDVVREAVEHKHFSPFRPTADMAC